MSIFPELKRIYKRIEGDSAVRQPEATVTVKNSHRIPFGHSAKSSELSSIKSSINTDSHSASLSPNLTSTDGFPWNLLQFGQWIILFVYPLSGPPLFLSSPNNHSSFGSQCQCLFLQKHFAPNLHGALFPHHVSLISVTPATAHIIK